MLILFSVIIFKLTVRVITNINDHLFFMFSHVSFVKHLEISMIARTYSKQINI